MRKKDLKTDTGNATPFRCILISFLKFRPYATLKSIIEVNIMIKKIVSFLSLLAFIFSFLVILPSSTYAEARCSWNFTPNTLNTGMGKLLVRIESPDLPDGKYHMLVTNSGLLNSARINAGKDFVFNHNGTNVVIETVAGSPWQAGKYSIELQTERGFLGTPGTTLCKTERFMQEGPAQTCSTEILDKNKLTPDVNVKMKIEGILPGSYDIRINDINKGGHYLNNGELDLGVFPRGSYKVSIRDKCGLLGANCHAGWLPNLICSQTSFNVKGSDEAEPGPVGNKNIIQLKDCPGGKGKGIDTAIGCVPIGDSGKTISWFLGWFIGISGGIAFLLIIFSGFQIMTASGDPQKLQGGREMLTAAVSGLILIIFSVFLLDLIGVKILQLPGF